MEPNTPLKEAIKKKTDLCFINQIIIVDAQLLFLQLNQTYTISGFTNIF